MVYKYKGRKLDFNWEVKDGKPGRPYTFIPHFGISILNGDDLDLRNVITNKHGVAKCGDHIYLIKNKQDEEFPIFTKREQKEAEKMIRQLYEVTKSNRTAYKMMYLRSLTVNGINDNRIFIPALVKVEIPRNHIVYHGMDHKCRTDYGIIKEVCDFGEIMSIAGKPVDNISYSINLPMLLLNKVDNMIYYHHRSCVEDIYIK